MNKLFNENSININIREINQAGEEEIEYIKSFSYANLSKIQKQEQDAFLYSDIKWEKTEILSISNIELKVAITYLGKNSDTEYNVLYSLINDSGVFDQFINNMQSTTALNIHDQSLLNKPETEFTFTNLDGSCLFKDDSKNGNLVIFEHNSSTDEEDRCWTGCVEETISEGSAAFLLVCMGTGPYCAAAIAIACAGCCISSSESCPP